MELEKISDVKWKLKGTKVPAYVFASEKLLEKMKSDRTLEQLRNVTALPGIYKQALCMPDGHQGYGFPIGGVAALDIHEGGISPGGIGYDINCLTPDTRILSPLGFYKTISELGNNEIVAVNNSFLMSKTKQEYETLSYNNGLKISKINYVMKKGTYKKILIIKTLLGRVIKCSADHEILTDKGMIKAGDLNKGDKVIINPFIGVKFEELSSRILIKEDNFEGQVRNNLKKRGLLPLRENNKKLPYIARLIGYSFGDGTIYYTRHKGFVNFYGNVDDLKRIQEDLRIVGFKSRIYSRKRKNIHELHCSSKSLAKLLEALGAPVGDKTRQGYLVPEWIMQSKKWIKRLFLTGFFSAELSTNLVLSQNKISKFIESGHIFLEQISDMLKEFGVRTNKISLRKEFRNKRGVRLRLIIASDSKTLINLYSRIGFDYNHKRNKKGLQAVNYLLYKESVKNIRKELEKQAIIMKNNGLTIREILQELNSTMINRRFVERKGMTRPPKGFITLDDFNKETLVDEELVKDEIISIKSEDYEGFLYDINVSDDKHNFYANGFIVSNCGVRLLRTNLTVKDVRPRLRELTNTLFENVPSGVGVGGKLGEISNSELNRVLEDGAEWALKNGYATEDDLLRTEENGRLQGNASLVSEKAKARGRDQLGSLGAGNHFLEVQRVSDIFDEETARGFGFFGKDQVTIMIHCGSRGLGHQVCSDYLREMERTFPDLVNSLPDRELIYAPAGSKLASNYWQAMNSAANFAWANRQLITYFVRKSFEKVFGDVEITQVYDVCHNICKVEEYDGKKLFVHRKGATRCMPKGHPLVPKVYRKWGQPALIPGTMGTGSYVVVGLPSSIDESFASTAHGAGRVMSRVKARKEWRGRKVKEELMEEGILVKGRSERGISEEAPGAYKDIDEVIRVTEKAGIAGRVVKLRPLSVIKG